MFWDWLLCTGRGQVPWQLPRCNVCYGRDAGAEAQAEKGLARPMCVPPSTSCIPAPLTSSMSRRMYSFTVNRVTWNRVMTSSWMGLTLPSTAPKATQTEATQKSALMRLRGRDKLGRRLGQR